MNLQERSDTIFSYFSVTNKSQIRPKCDSRALILLRSIGSFPLCLSLCVSPVCSGLYESPPGKGERVNA